MNQLSPGTPLQHLQHMSGPAGISAGNALLEAPEEGQTIIGLFRILRRRWQIVVLVALVTFALGTIVCLLMTPRYAATSIIEINKDDDGADTGARSTALAPNADEVKTEIQTDITLLQSDETALAAIRDLNLMSKRPFRKAVFAGEEGRPLDQAPRTREKAIALFERDLKVESPADTRLINVTFQNPDADVAADVANKISRNFIENTMERRHRSTLQVAYWLQRQLDDLKKQVEASEQRLADYQRKPGLAGIQLAGGSASDGPGGVTHNTVTERLFSLNQELTAAEANRISTETVYRLVSTQDPEVVLGLGSMSVSSGSGGGSGALTSDGGIQLVRALRTQEGAISQDYAATAVKYGANNPRLMQLQQQLDAVRQQMRAELERISKRAENAFRYSRANEDTIRQQFTKQQSAANALADDTVHLQVLAQEAYSNRALYESLFSKLQTSSLASGVRATRIDVVQGASPAGTPAVPSYNKILPLLAGVGLLFGISSAFLRESLDETVRTSRDLGDFPGLNMLAYIPTIQKHLRKNDGDRGNLLQPPNAPFSEAFRVLRTSINLETGSLRRKVFLVTSPLGGDGKTTVVYNLGVAFAQQGARVLLIDGDLRNPGLHRMFGCKVSPGLGDLDILPKDNEVSGVVQHSVVPKLFMLPAGRSPDLPAELFGSKSFEALLEMCAHLYDYVLVDSPPVLAVADASIIATSSTGVIAVLRSGSTTRPIFAQLVKAIQRTGTPTIGVLLNDVRNPTLDGFYDYTYSRQKGTDEHANA